SQHGWLVPGGQPVQLTSEPGHEGSPAVAPDGRRIAYTSVDPHAGTARIRVLAGTASTPLSEGPLDTTPAWSPDGETIAFAALSAPAEPGGRPDMDLHIMRADGTGRRLVVREPLADQTGPVWSRDGRYL